MTYKVVLSRQAQRYFASAPVPVAGRLSTVFRLLEREARPRGFKTLKGELQGLMRIRVGDLRVIYEVDEKTGEIRVIKIGPRGDVY